MSFKFIVMRQIALEYDISTHQIQNFSGEGAESVSAVDGTLRCCGSAGTVQTSMAVQCRVDTCRP